MEEDEEIDEDMAFTAEDKIRYAGMFGDEPDDGEPAGEDLLASDVSEDENFADVSAWQSPVYTLLQGPLTVDVTELTILVLRRTAQRMERRMRAATATTSGGMQPCWPTCGRRAMATASASGGTS